MNCKAFQKMFLERLGEGFQPLEAPELAAHAQACPDCARFARQMDQTFAALRPSPTIQAPVGFKEKVMNEIVSRQAAAPARRRPTLWKPALALGSLVSLAVLVAALLASGAFTGGAKAYAIEQTIQAVRAVRYVCFNVEVNTKGKGGGQFWAEFDERGQMLRARVSQNTDDDGPKEILWRDGKAEVWIKQKQVVMVVQEKQLLEKLRQQMDFMNPMGIITQLQDGQAKGLLTYSTEMPMGKNDPIVLKVDWKKTEPDQPKHEVFWIDPDTKLLLQVDRYYSAEESPASFNATIKFEYPKTLDEKIFKLEPPAGVMRIDQTAKPIGLVQGALTPEQIGRELASQFFAALIMGDHDKAGLLYEGIPGAMLKAMLAAKGIKFIRVVEIGQPKPFKPVNGWRIPCKVELEVKGQRSVEPFNLNYRQVHGQPERWTINGGF